MPAVKQNLLEEVSSACQMEMTEQAKMTICCLHLFMFNVNLERSIDRRIILHKIDLKNRDIVSFFLQETLQSQVDLWEGSCLESLVH